MAATISQVKALRSTIPTIEWRVQSFAKEPYNYDAKTSWQKPQGTCVSYTPVEGVVELLDQVVGPDNWCSDITSVDSPFGKLTIYRLGINIEGSGWVYKSDTGSATDDIDKGKVHKTLLSDGLKRAAAMWGVGRIHKFLPKINAPADKFASKDDKFSSKPKLVKSNGKPVYDVSAHIHEAFAEQIKAAVLAFKAVDMNKILSEEHEEHSVQAEDTDGFTLEDYEKTCEELFKEHKKWNWEVVDQFRQKVLAHDIATIERKDISADHWNEIITAIQKKKGSK